MSIVKSSKNKDQLLLNRYRYRHANKSQIIWRCCENNCVCRVRFDRVEYAKLRITFMHQIQKKLYQ